MRHHRQTPAERAAPLASRATPDEPGIPSAIPLLALAVHLCVAGDPAR
ncbi:hypothetical protein JOF35_002288 [Streptomyces demainii]|uniref:Uncharacterized protein n=1 Tax=Streptomyces demainii TaxID=588122 RepID=A0ABT9KRH1_9ACTN|nr:hypothetical protein [Streptomyces demainii]